MRGPTSVECSRCEAADNESSPTRPVRKPQSNPVQPRLARHRAVYDNHPEVLGQTARTYAAIGTSMGMRMLSRNPQFLSAGHNHACIRAS